jgi:hypothetical protein
MFLPWEGAKGRKRGDNIHLVRSDINLGDAVVGDEAQLGVHPDIINPSSPPEAPMVNTSHDLVGYNRANGGGRHDPPLDWDNTPITFNRIGTRWGDIQLKNGLANGVASGRIQGYRGEGWYDNVVPYLPGQTRLIGGGMPGYYPAKGPAPSQWDNAYNSGPGQQPMYPGGPGYVVGTEIYNPGSGG